MAVGIVYDERFLLHDPGAWHPESPARLKAIWNILNHQTWFHELAMVQAKPAGLEWISEIHDPEYIRRAEESCKKGEDYFDSPDVGINRHSFETAVLAAGGALALADALMEGKISAGVGLLRPPGHHARSHEAMGFCIFNNIAILARYLQKKHGLKKICIVDWDVHHGNGTQEVFYRDASVYYISLHQYPHYPGTGSEDETGEGEGKGKTLNFTMNAFSGDHEYQGIFQEHIIPEIKKFRPEIILVSAGFDAHEDDPLAQIHLSTPMFGWMTEQLAYASRDVCGGRMISVLEGGYNLQRLGECVVEHVRALAEMNNDK